MAPQEHRPEQPISKSTNFIMSSFSPDSSTACRELILGGQRSGKSRRAEMLARHWLDAGVSGRRAVFIATGSAHDEEMRARIERHRADRAARLPSMQTVEEPLALADVVQQHLSPDCLVVVDCLTLWLANHGEQLAGFIEAPATQAFLDAITRANGPLVMVSNEIGLGVVPLGREVRAYVDALGWLNQQVAARCDRVCLMAAGLPLWLKPAGGPARGMSALSGEAAVTASTAGAGVDGISPVQSDAPVPSSQTATPAKPRKFIRNSKGDRIEWQD